MRIRVNKQDWSKPFKMVFSKNQFDDLETLDDTVINIQPKEAATIQKQQIITPYIETVKRHTEVKPFAKITPNYIRLAAHLNVPKINDYELTELDHVFLQTNRQKFKLNGKIILNPEFFKSVIIALEIKQGKDQNIPKNKQFLLTFLEKQYKQLSKISNYEIFTDLIYNYWRSRRQETKFPLYRPLWRPTNQQQYNNLLAFRFRQKDKRILRRTRASQDDIMQQMANQLSIALKISQRVQLRQQLKQKQLQVQMSIFHQQLKLIFPYPDFLFDFNQQIRNKEKQKIKKYSLQVQRIKKDHQYKNQEIKIPEPTIFDQKQSIVNFLATVVYEAQLCGINYEKLFHYKSQPVQTIHAPLSPSIQIPVIEKEEQQILHMTLKRAGQHILRKFEEESSDQSSMFFQNYCNGLSQVKKQHNKQYYEDLFDFKKSQITKFYFGEDEEGQYQSLRKSISLGFKKFLSTKEFQ